MQKTLETPETDTAINSKEIQKIVEKLKNTPAGNIQDSKGNPINILDHIKSHYKTYLQDIKLKNTYNSPEKIQRYIDIIKKNQRLYF